jgi:hypothetical protein
MFLVNHYLLSDLKGIYPKWMGKKVILKLLLSV